MTNQQSESEPTRRIDLGGQQPVNPAQGSSVPGTPAQDDDWFWARPTQDLPAQSTPVQGTVSLDRVAQGEPTQQLPRHADEPTTFLARPSDEPTQVIGLDDTRTLPPVPATGSGAPAGANAAYLDAQQSTAQQPTVQQPTQAQPTAGWTAAANGQGAIPEGYPQQGYAGQAYGAQTTTAQNPAGQSATQPGAGQGGWLPPVGPPTLPSGQPLPGQPAGATPVAGTASTSSKRRGRGLLALVGVGAVAAVAVAQGPNLVSDIAGSGASSSAPSVQAGQGTSGQSGSSGQSGTSNGSSNSGTSNNGGSGQSGTSGQSGASGSGAQPAEQQPFDPWGQSGTGQSGSGQSGSGQSGTGQSGQSGSGQWGQGSDQSGSGTSQTGTSSASQTTATAAQSKGVVLITTKTTQGAAAGTGMVLTTNGYVLTNYHVVQSSTQVQVEVASTKKTYTATVVGHDASHDVALLKLDDASGLDTVTIDKDEVSSGQAITAVGNSEGQGYLSAAKGTITSLQSSITVSDESSSAGQEALTNVIKTTAGAVPGDSGGPMYDAEGEVVGMTTAGEQSSSGPSTQSVTVASYAVPIDRAISIVDQIEQGKESGSLKVGPNAYLGISVQTLGGSFVVASVVSDGPAARAGITAGSQITAVGGTAVSSQAELAAELATHNPGDKVSVTWTDQSGDVHRDTVTLGSSPVN